MELLFAFSHSCYFLNENAKKQIKEISELEVFFYLPLSFNLKDFHRRI